MNIEKKYCAFIDVLGYYNILKSERKIEEKVKIFSDIYLNLFQAISRNIAQIHRCRVSNHELFVKSFSDSIYLESSDPSQILFTLHHIYNFTLGYNTLMDPKEKYTPLLRSGVVFDWTTKFMDIGALAKYHPNEIANKPEFQNVIGAGIAEAYKTSENSQLSGMRIIIKREVVSNLKLEIYNKVPFECYFFECKNFLKQEHFEKTHKPVKLYFLPVNKNERADDIDLLEMCWPVFSYYWSHNGSDIHDMISALRNMAQNFDTNSYRHFKKTAELLEKALQITISLDDNQFDSENTLDAFRYLHRIIESKH